MQEGGAHFWGLDTAVSRGGGGAHPCTPVSEGGSKIYYVVHLYGRAGVITNQPRLKLRG